jgi:3-methyl-2-oxobutanoate hydroxymethyltransferase
MPVDKNLTAATPGKAPRREEKVTVKTFLKMKQKGEKIVILTAYDFFTAKILDELGIDSILVGDSANMVFYGAKNTLSITLEQMLYHTKAVSSAIKRALVIGDMPFLSYQTSISEAILNAGRFLKEGGADGVKIEGGTEMVSTVRRLIEVGIPVMGHIGMTPQSTGKFGGYSVQGKNEKTAQYLLDSAKALEEVECFSIVLECIPKELAKKITSTLKIPTIGIGAGLDCDGQVLVVNDILGLYEEFKPKFVRRYAELGKEIRKACKSFIEDVKAKKYPAEEESY